MASSSFEIKKDYKYGFVSPIEADEIPKGLDDSIIRMISEKKQEPEFMLNFRLKAFAHWQKMTEPRWANVEYPEIDFQNARYYSAPKRKTTSPEGEQAIDGELLE